MDQFLKRAMALSLTVLFILVIVCVFYPNAREAVGTFFGNLGDIVVQFIKNGTSFFKKS